MRYKAVVFDLDGTLMDTLGGITYALNEAAKRLGTATFSQAQTKAMIGNGIKKLIERAFADYSCQEKEQAYSVFTNEYAACASKMSKPYLYAAEFLLKLRANGIKVAVASNKDDYAVKQLVSSYFNGCVDYAVGATKNNPLKPHPYMINCVLSELGVKNAEIAYVGDSEVDLLTAANAKADCYIVSWGYSLRDDIANAFSFEQLYDLLVR